MKTKELNVPKEVIEEFANLLAEHNITNEIQGTTDNEEIIVKVEYENEERQSIFELMELIDDFNSEDEE